MGEKVAKESKRELGLTSYSISKQTPLMYRIIPALSIKFEHLLAHIPPDRTVAKSTMSHFNS